MISNKAARLAAASAFALPVHASDHNDAARRQASDALMADYHGQGPGAARRC